MSFYIRYSGCGNDFVMFDRCFSDRSSFFSEASPNFIEKVGQLCDRQAGVGADGVIFLDQPSKEFEGRADFRMRIFNRDGSEAEMCGNGIRCLFAFAKECGWGGEEARIETLCGVLRAMGKGEEVEIEMVDPRIIETGLMVEGVVGVEGVRFDWLNTGVPHLVGFLGSEGELERINLREVGPKLRYHEKFGKGGVNVNFAYMVGKNRLKVRTYERGVEGETLACGTGATAVAIAGACRWGVGGPVEVVVASGESLWIDFQRDGSSFFKVKMAGRVKREEVGIGTALVWHD